MVRIKNRWILFEVIFEDNKIPPLPSLLPRHQQHEQISSGGEDGDAAQPSSWRQHSSTKQPQTQSNTLYITTKEIHHALRDSICLNFGDVGIGCVSSSLNVKYFSPFTNNGILRVSRDHYRIIWGALTFINEIRGRRCLVHVLHVGGTIKKCQLACIQHNRDQILKRRQAAESRGDGNLEPFELLLEKSQKEVMTVTL
ncbi:12499_t:CDS:2 [Ambispora gerdemannii]|uniref:Ribonuclease P/MRP protein subunit POP5 n=1 Tax=Ambispora gerdemannii TaxID=144530 RepID=A0A9N8V0Q5_9GLOM|nr:12499_t:CDS:2 [Ambispora gerdemannii]